MISIKKEGDNMYINVLVETKVKSNDMTFTYYVPDNFDKDLVGKRVKVPFGTRTLEGFVIGYSKKTEDYKIKPILKVIDEEKILNDELLNLGKFISDKYLCSLIYAYQVMLPKALKANIKTTDKAKYLTYVKLNDNYKDDDIKVKQQLEIIELLKNNAFVLKNSIKSKSSLNKLIDKGLVIEYKKEIYREAFTRKDEKKITLTSDQLLVSNKIKALFGKSKTALLYGVTGSGKTEVYIEVVKEVIKRGKTAIILVPEISLTPQITARFKGYFKENIAILHSALSDGERFDEWRRINRGEVSVVIGARSAIFAPLKNIGIIIIDEEHSESYKQENNPRYNTIDIAFKRSQTHNCPVILGSATPTIESYARAKKGYYELFILDKRINKKPLPKVQIVDMKREIRKGNNIFSELLKESIKECLDKNEQVMLLLNRRGYANYLTCQNCGFVYKCPNCDITLTYHKTSGIMRCHYCGYGTKKDLVCPSCREQTIRQMGTGTEKIEEYLKEEFIGAKVLRMDADTTSKKGSHFKIINDFNDGAYNILVGTQMIAKGLNFPNVTLVGVINGDSSLNIPNFRSCENTFNLLDQVIGRAGRHQKEGRAIIQTFNPEHYSIVEASKHNYEGFYQKEMLVRKKLNYPPYCFITLIKISTKDFNYGINEAKKISFYLKDKLSKTTSVLGPSMASVLRVNNNYNFQVILKYKKDEVLYNTLSNILKIYEGNQKIKIELDFNPITL